MVGEEGGGGGLISTFAYSLKLLWISNLSVQARDAEGWDGWTAQTEQSKAAGMSRSKINCLHCAKSIPENRNHMLTRFHHADHGTWYFTYKVRPWIWQVAFVTFNLLSCWGCLLCTMFSHCAEGWLATCTSLAGLDYICSRVEIHHQIVNRQRIRCNLVSFTSDFTNILHCWHRLTSVLYQ